MPALAGRHAQLRLLPVQVVQPHCRDLARPQPIAYEQEQQRVVALADRRAAIDAVQHPLNIGPAIARGMDACL